MKTATLHKGAETFCISYEIGNEAPVIDELVRMVKSPDLNFDWFDAAILSHQISANLSKELQSYMPKGAI